MLGFAQREGKGRSAHTWWVLVAGEGPNEDLAKGPTTLDLGTWEPGVRRRSASCARRERERALASEREKNRQAVNVGRSGAIWIPQGRSEKRPVGQLSATRFSVVG